MNKEKDLETVIVLALASLIIYIKFDANWGIYLAMGFLALSIISKKAINILSKIWFSFSHYLPDTNTSIFFSTITRKKSIS